MSCQKANYQNVHLMKRCDGFLQVSTLMPLFICIQHEWRYAFQTKKHAGVQDFDSEKLRTKHHWNSFTTDFFWTLSSVRASLEATGSCRVDSAAAKKVLATELLCHRCGGVQRSMPALKSHLAVCQAAIPGQR